MSTSKQPQTPCVKYSEAIAIDKDKLNIRYKETQETVDKNFIKQIEQVARKTIRIATKVKILKYSKFKK